jgi:hypothetical protein
VTEAEAFLRPTREADPHAHAFRPVEYAERVLGITTLTDEQRQILRALHKPPYRVLVPSAHDVGKTFIAAVAANYWYDSFKHGLVLTTAPTERDVNDLLWTELRLQRHRASLDCTGLAPKAAYMGTGPDHYAAGYVSRLGQGFQGRHRERMLFIKDEADGVAPLHWTTTETMCDPALGCAEIAIFNPTNTTSAAYQEDLRCDEADGTPKWHRIRLSALNHPNVLAELRGEPRPIRGAVSLDMLNRWVEEWCEPVHDPEDVRATDIEWPPSSVTGGPGKWYRPGPDFQARGMGLWPDAGAGVWSPSIWEACLQLPPDGVQGLARLYPSSALPELGGDCATGKGDDFFALHGRWGTVSVHHETSNTMDPARIFARIKAACALLAGMANSLRDRNAQPVSAKDIPIKLDDDGTGGAVGAFLREEGYTVYLVGAGTRAIDAEHYVRRRDELWFHAAGRARAGLIKVGLLDRPTRARLRQQLLAPAWSYDEHTGRRVVESKDETKAKIGRSPDDADALLLAFLEGVAFEAPTPIENPRPRRLDPSDPQRSHARRRNLFGMR